MPNSSARVQDITQSREQSAYRQQSFGPTVLFGRSPRATIHKGTGSSKFSPVEDWTSEIVRVLEHDVFEEHLTAMLGCFEGDIG